MTTLAIPLPQGLSVSGVAVWAVRTATALAERGMAIVLIRHPEPEQHRPLAAALASGVELVDLRSLGPIRAESLPLFAKQYRAIVDRQRPGPVVFAPSLVGDAFGIVCALAQSDPERVRMLGVQHSDIAYDTRVLAHYEQAIGRFIAPSIAIERRLAQAIPHRLRDILRIPHGVAVPPRCPLREPPSQRPIRLIYAGRIEHTAKRIGALPLLADELSKRGIAHEIVLLGDGPAAGEIDAACAIRPTIRREPPVAPEDVSRSLAWADALLLPSRYEGMSLSLLEALAAGAVPIAPRGVSGVDDVVEHGRTGALMDLSPDDDERAAATALADAVESVRLRDMSSACHAFAQRTLDMQRIAGLYHEAIDALASEPGRPWPLTRPCAFANTEQAASGTVPPGAADALARALAKVGAGPILLHGAGQHTIELAPRLAHAPIAAIVDDEPTRQGTTLLGWPVIAWRDADRFGATHIIISSWLNQAEIVRRHADRYRAMGLEVVTLY